MAVQLLEDWLLKEQEKTQPNRGAQSSPSEGAWFDLYRRLHRRVFPHS